MTFAVRTLQSAAPALLPSSSLTSLLLMDGTNGSTTFTDSKGTTWTANGNAQISTAQSVFGGASGLFDGSGDYVSAAYASAIDLLPGSFILSGWMYPTGSWASAGRRIWATCGSTIAWNSTTGIHVLCQLLGTSSSAKLNLQIANGTGTPLSATHSVSVPIGSWSHFVFQHDSAAGKIGLGLNGAMEYTTASGASRPSTNPTAQVASIPTEDATAGYAFQGYLDALSVAKSAPVVGASYIVPQAPY